MSSDQTIAKTFHLPKNYIEALETLRRAGVSTDGSLTKISNIMQVIEDSWAKHFPSQPFPKEGDNS